MNTISSMNTLLMSKTECLRTYLQANGKPYDKLVVGAIIFKSDDDGNPGILLLKRAAHENIYPNIFEIPGGKVEDSDATIQAAVEREVFEETGMEVAEFLNGVKSFDYALEKKVLDDAGSETLVRYTSLQLNYVCRVSKHNLTINSEEHSEGKFVSRLELSELKVTEQMRTVVEEGLVWADYYLAWRAIPV
ncbi:MAG: hypothetical protein Q9195_003276 [Heterodermia aff. obscurata]